MKCLLGFQISLIATVIAEMFLTHTESQTNANLLSGEIQLHIPKFQNQQVQEIFIHIAHEKFGVT